MTSESKLQAIKLVHTVIWIFFNIVIFYMLYAVVTDQLGIWLWISYGLFGLEILTLLAFRFYCPLTVLARRYSDSQKANFDIYLPNWLAKFNKLIYGSILTGVIAITIYRLLT